MNKLYLITIFLCYALMAMGQGQIKRPHRTVKPKVEISEPDGYINGHGYVNLGLPSGLKWATCNVGAVSPSDYGGFYAWGETKTKSYYDWDNYFDTWDNRNDSKNLYNNSRMKLIVPSSGHETARENWGGTWRMPTEPEFKELLVKCRWVWTSINGHGGYKVIGPNGKSIFLPAAGYIIPTSHISAGIFGSYWTNALGSFTPNDARYLHFGDRNKTTSYIISCYNGTRCHGRSVRSVSN